MDKKLINDFETNVKIGRYLIFHYSCSDITSYPIIISSISTFDNITHQEKKFSRTEFTERESIQKFLDYVGDKIKEKYVLIGWNVNKEIYGIVPLIRRYRELTGNTHKLSNYKFQVFDLDEILKEISPEFKGGLHNIMLFNSINLDLFLFGKEEIEYFKRNEFQKLDNSTMKKVRSIHKILQKYQNKSMRTTPQSKWRELNIFIILKTRKILIFLKTYEVEIEISIITAILVEIIFGWFE